MTGATGGHRASVGGAGDDSKKVGMARGTDATSAPVARRTGLAREGAQGGVRLLRCAPLLALLPLLLCAPVLLPACGAPQQGEDRVQRGVFPQDVGAHLAGRWAVLNPAGEEIASMLFIGERVTALSEGAWFRGRWTTAQEGDMLALRVRFSEASEQGVRMVLGEERELLLRLVPLGEDRILTLQANGQWATWSRRLEEEE